MSKIIKADFEIAEHGLTEFIRILVPELKDQDIEIKTLRDDDIISLEVKGNGKKVKTEYKNISGKLPWQKLVMTKTALLKLENKNYKWGGMIGVRPTKVVRKFFQMGLSEEEIFDVIKNLYLVHSEKIKLLIDIVKIEMEHLNNDLINIYIGIPFCPTKCTYCSFASYEKKGKYRERYNDFLDKLNEEIVLIGKKLASLGKKVESIYIGGGTPTILKNQELKVLLETVKNSFSFEDLKEYTLEAGRIDTIDDEKLKIAKDLGVGRVSINPQTFNAKTLAKLNRYWDEDRFNRVYNDAKDLGFVINMDLIFGLPNETTADIIKTLEKTLDYDIENLTVHMLAIKRASKLKKENYEIEVPDYEKVYEKLDEVLEKKSMRAYYMYRQKSSIDWGENTGFAVKGTESLFNIEMIEEYQDTIAMGGGAITKLIYKDKIERLVNPKDPIVYMNEFDERIEKKLKKLYEKYSVKK